jgi:hypothetical protein
VTIAAVVVIIMVGYLMNMLGLFGLCPPAKPEFCIEIYSPVLGVPTFRVHGNSCLACSEGAWLWIRAGYAGMIMLIAVGLVDMMRVRS